MIRINLDKALAARNMTMYQLGKATGVRPNTLSQWFNDEELRKTGKNAKSITLDVLDSVCRALNCPVSEIIEYVPDDK